MPTREMNEIIQQQVKPIGFDLDFDVVDWGTIPKREKRTLVWNELQQGVSHSENRT